MNNVFVYCELEETTVQEVSQELLTKGRKLANKLGVDLHAIVAGSGIKGKVEDQILPYVWTSYTSLMETNSFPIPQHLTQIFS